MLFYSFTFLGNNLQAYISILPIARPIVRERVVDSFLCVRVCLRLLFVLLLIISVIFFFVHILHWQKFVFSSAPHIFLPLFTFNIRLCDNNFCESIDKLLKNHMRSIFVVAAVLLLRGIIPFLLRCVRE